MGVLLYLVLHDLSHTLGLGLFLELALGGPAAVFALVAAALVAGGGAVIRVARPKEDGGETWTPILLFVGLILALHSAVDGFIVGTTLQQLEEAEVLALETLGLQMAHRFLEGGVLVVLGLAAGVKKSRLTGAVLYVGLPFLVAVPAAPALDLVLAAAIVFFLSLVAASALFLLLVLALWPAIAMRGFSTQAAQWLLVGLFVALVAHGLGE